MVEKSYEQVRQLEMQLNSCNRRAEELYKVLSQSGSQASSMVEYLNRQKLRILIAQIKLFLEKIRSVFG